MCHDYSYLFSFILESGNITSGIHSVYHQKNYNIYHSTKILPCKVDYNIELIEGNQKIMESLNKLQDTIEKANEVHDKCIKMELEGKLEPGTCNK
jgi:hypothetical protein